MNLTAPRAAPAPALDRAMILRAQGADPDRTAARRPRLMQLAERALREGLSLLRPEVIERRLTVSHHGHARLQLAGGTTLRVPALVEGLAGAEEIVVLLATVGDGIARAAQRAAAGEPTYALALEAVGTAGVQEVASAHLRDLVAGSADRRWQLGAPLSPGMEGWSLLEGQRLVFDLIGRTGSIRLTERAMMTPRHSLSMLIGLGPDLGGSRTACARCGVRARCRYRTDPC